MRSSLLWPVNATGRSDHIEIVKQNGLNQSACSYCRLTFISSTSRQVHHRRQFSILWSIGFWLWKSTDLIRHVTMHSVCTAQAGEESRVPMWQVYVRATRHGRVLQLVIPLDAGDLFCPVKTSSVTKPPSLMKMTQITEHSGQMYV